MKTKEDIESFLLRSELAYEELGDGLWVLRGAGDVEQIVLKFAPPVLVCRVHIMNVPDKDREECFRMLLDLNAREMVHGAYGIEDGKIVISGALQLENMDFNEFQAIIDDITLAVADHYARLSRFRHAA